MDINEGLIQSHVMPMRKEGKAGLMFTTSFRNKELTTQFLPIEIVYNMYKWFRTKEKKELELHRIMEDDSKKTTTEKLAKEL